MCTAAGVLLCPPPPAHKNFCCSFLIFRHSGIRKTPPSHPRPPPRVHATAALGISSSAWRSQLPPKAVPTFFAASRFPRLPAFPTFPYSNARSEEQFPVPREILSFRYFAAFFSMHMKKAEVHLMHPSIHPLAHSALIVAKPDPAPQQTLERLHPYTGHQPLLLQPAEFFQLQGVWLVVCDL